MIFSFSHHFTWLLVGKLAIQKMNFVFANKFLVKKWFIGKGSTFPVVKHLREQQVMK
jgi:hypothetical protein